MPSAEALSRGMGDVGIIPTCSLDLTRGPVLSTSSVACPAPLSPSRILSSRCPRCCFFEWADEVFPRCKQHPQRPTILRTVLKQGENNGRRFFVCHASLDNPQKCGFFQWARHDLLSGIPGDSVLL